VPDDVSPSTLVRIEHSCFGPRLLPLFSFTMGFSAHLPSIFAGVPIAAAAGTVFFASQTAFAAAPVNTPPRTTISPPISTVHGFLTILCDFSAIFHWAGCACALAQGVSRVQAGGRGEVQPQHQHLSLRHGLARRQARPHSRLVPCYSRHDRRQRSGALRQ
jgi:hypothetical protein